MTRLRFLLVSFFAAVGAALGFRNRTGKQFQGTARFWNRSLMKRVKPEGVAYQWRKGGVAMSPVFRSQDEAMSYPGPFVPSMNA